ncbi:MAG: hypothetical protein KGZ97_04900 [Bacteroidetes bacterium]|nr:hypothetical protein [Bacteroidota bacterium]
MKKLAIILVIFLVGIFDNGIGTDIAMASAPPSNSKPPIYKRIIRRVFSGSRPPSQSRKPIKQSRRSKALTPKGWEFGPNIGTSNSLTEIGGSRSDARGFIMDTQFETTSINLGAFAKYRFNYTFVSGLTFNYGHIHGADSLSPPNSSRYNRGFSFQNNIYELAFITEVYAPRIYYSVPLDIYGYLGVGGFYHNPKLTVPNPDTFVYDEFSKYQVVFPIGLGANYTFMKKYRVGIDIGWRKTFTSYLNGFTRPWSEGYNSYYFTAAKFTYFLDMKKKKRKF